MKIIKKRIQDIHENYNSILIGAQTDNSVNLKAIPHFLF